MKPCRRFSRPEITSICKTIFVCIPILGGCSPNLDILDITDTHQGYQKSALITVETGALEARALEARMAPLSADGGPTLDGAIGEKGLVIFPGSERLRSQPAAMLSLYLKSEFWLNPWTSRDDYAFRRFVVEDAARIELSGVPECIPALRSAKTEARSLPAPTRDKFSIDIAIKEQGTNACLASTVTSNGDHSVTSITIEALCPTTASISASAPTRPLISGSVPRVIRIVDAIIPPTSLSVTTGPVVPPPLGSQWQTTVREVELKWTPPSGVIEYVVEIFEKGSTIPIEESLLASSHRVFRTILPSGKAFSWHIRSRLPGCSGAGEWSEFSALNHFDT